MAQRISVRGSGVLAAVCAAICGVVSAQSTLPPTGPTSAPPATIAPLPAPSHRAQVSYQSGQLTVIAENSSLDQILREIARQTGMTITGGVTDQQVFGTYGPDRSAEVLGALLEGSGSNMMLRETVANEPMELVLTPMQGTPMPPDLGTRPGDDRNAAPPPQPGDGASRTTSDQQSGTPSPGRPEYVSPPQPEPVIRQPGDAPAPQPQAAPADGNPQSPNGVMSPQQIYQQLQKLQQQQPQPPAGSQ